MSSYSFNVAANFLLSWYFSNLLGSFVEGYLTKKPSAYFTISKILVYPVEIGITPKK